MRHFLHLLSSLVLVVSTTAITGLDSLEAQQDVRYTTVSEMEMGGAMGRLMQMGMGDATKTTQTVYLTENRMRTDGDGSSSIWDLENRRFIHVDHEAQQYSVMDFDEWMQQLESMSEATAEEMQRAETGEGEADLDIRVSTDATDETREIEGMEARRVFVTMKMEGEAPPREAGAEPQQGTIVYLTELWLTDDLPTFRSLVEDEALRESMENAWTDQTMAFEQMFANNPDLRVGLDQSEAELADMQGTTLESTVHMILVPEGVEFDREKALADAEADLGGDAAAAAGEEAKEQAMDAMKSLGGLLGGEEDEEEEEEPELTQRTFMRIITRISEVQRGPLSADLFQPPEGYTEVESPFSAGMPGG